MPRVLVAALMLLAVLPSAASAHATVTSDAGRVSWRSADPDSPSKLVVTVAGDGIRFVDPSEHGGMSATAPCAPGAVDEAGSIREVTCPKAGVTELFVDLDGGDDQAKIDVPLPITASGRLGNDTITTSVADDTIYGGEGNDVLDPGAGSDVAQGEAGDDQLKVRDGVSDTVVCADGADSAETDERDAVAADAGCESVNGSSTPDGTPRSGPVDAIAPRVEVPGGRRQRARRGRFTLRVGVDEAASLTLSGVLRSGGRTYKLKSVRSRADGSGLKRMTVRLSARARAALRRSKRATARISVAAKDPSGNVGRLRLRVVLRT